MPQPYSAMTFPDHALADIATELVALRPWLIAGALLVTPFPARETGPTFLEIEAIAAMGARLASDRRAGRLLDGPVFWFRPLDGRYTPFALFQAWLRLRAQQHVAVDLRLLEVMGGSVLPVQLLRVRPARPKGASQRRAPVPSHTEAAIGARPIPQRRAELPVQHEPDAVELYRLVPVGQLAIGGR
jgi:hypothetical protein